MAGGIVEGAQKAHYIVVVFHRRQTAARHPIEQISIGTVEQGFEAVELGGVKGGEGDFRE
jgi:hypothetical protein